MIFEDLLKEFKRIDAIEHPIEKQYELEISLEKSGMGREAYIRLFNLYQAKKKEEQWLSCCYLAPFVKLEKLIEKSAAVVNEMDIFKIIQQIGNIAIVFTVASLIWNIVPKQDKEIEEAWKVIESKEVGRMTRYSAIEKLNRYKQPLDHLSLPPKVYLARINLEEANLNNSVLPEAILIKANLKRAKLRGANLIGANLWKAKLQRLICVGLT